MVSAHGERVCNGRLAVSNFREGCGHADLGREKTGKDYTIRIAVLSF